MGAEYYTDLEGFAVSRWQASSGKQQDNATAPKDKASVEAGVSAEQRKALEKLEQEGDLRIHPRLT